MKKEDIASIEISSAQKQGLEYRWDKIADVMNAQMVYRRELKLYMIEMVQAVGADTDAEWQANTEKTHLMKVPSKASPAVPTASIPPSTDAPEPAE